MSNKTLDERCDDYYRKLNTLLKSWRLHAPDEEYLLIRDLQARVKELELSAARYEILKSKAFKKTAYDVYGVGCAWHIGVHCDDSRKTFDQAVDESAGAAP